MSGSLQEAVNGWLVTAATAVGLITAIAVPVRGWLRERQLHALQANPAGAGRFATAGAGEAVAAELEEEDTPPPSQEIVDALERILASGDEHAEAEADRLAGQAEGHRQLLDQIAALRRAIEDLTAYLKRLLG